MSPFDIFSRHPRGDISAQADGELAPDRRRTLEAHLAACERCRTEMDDLLSVRSALRGLPQVAAPRSFALTPAMAERERAPVAYRTTPSFVAMRVAGAGFAAVLAVVVMLDAGGIVDDPGGSSSDESSTALFEDDPTNRSADATTVPSADSYAPKDVSPSQIPGGGVGGPPVNGDGGTPVAGGGSGGVGGGVSPPEGSEDAPDDALPDDDSDAPAAGGVGGGPAPVDGVEDGQDPVGATTETGNFSGLSDAGGANDKTAAPEAFSSEDDGVSLLLVIEIGLAAIALLAIGGSFVMRRRAESE